MTSNITDWTTHNKIKSQPIQQHNRGIGAALTDSQAYMFVHTSIDYSGSPSNKSILKRPSIYSNCPVVLYSSIFCLK